MKNTLTIKNVFLYPIVVFLKQTALLSALSCRLVQWTGKHPDPIHPKHLLQIRHPWYLSYIKKSDRVLDIGCNNGQHSLKIAKIAQKIYGFDYDKNLLKLARKEALRLHIKNTHFIYGNAQKKFPFKNSQFDVVVLLDVFEHLNERKKILEEIKRALKKGGRLLISIPNSDTSWKRLQKDFGLFYFSDPDHKVEFTEKEIRLVLKNAGFKVQKLFPVTFDTPLVGLIDCVGGISFPLYRKLCEWRRDEVLKNPSESIGFEIVATI